MSWQAHAHNASVDYDDRDDHRLDVDGWISLIPLFASIEVIAVCAQREKSRAKIKFEWPRIKYVQYLKYILHLSMNYSKQEYKFLDQVNTILNRVQENLDLLLNTNALILMF